MEQTKLDRINFLANKSKTEPLSEEEKREQKKLREEYILEFRASFTGILENTYIKYPNGEKVKVERKDKK